MENISEKDLILKAKNNDNEAMKELIKNYNGLIYSLANNLVITCESLEVDDLYQEGVLGLMLAIKRYNINSNIKLITYAYYYIKGYMLKCIKKFDRLVRYPDRVIEKIENIRKKIEELNNKLLRKASFIEILENIDITSEELKEYLVLNQKIARLEDIKFGYYAMEDNEYLDLYYQLEDDFNLEETIANKILADMVYNSSELKDKEKQMLYLRYHEQMSLDEIASRVGYSKEGVRRAKRRCLEHAKNNIIK